jgi:hypothetical protein
MASINTKKACSKCNKQAVIATCNECQDLFCSKHFNEHRQDLSQQMNNTGQECDLL